MVRIQKSGPEMTFAFAWRDSASGGIRGSDSGLYETKQLTRLMSKMALFRQLTSYNLPPR